MRCAACDAALWALLSQTGSNNLGQLNNLHLSTPFLISYAFSFPGCVCSSALARPAPVTDVSGGWQSIQLEKLLAFSPCLGGTEGQGSPCHIMVRELRAKRLIRQILKSGVARKTLSTAICPYIPSISLRILTQKSEPGRPNNFT